MALGAPPPLSLHGSQLADTPQFVSRNPEWGIPFGAIVANDGPPKRPSSGRPCLCGLVSSKTGGEPVDPVKKSFSFVRVLAATFVLVVLALGIAWYQGMFRPRGDFRPTNSLMILVPYRHGGTWVFDDPDVGLRREPFVAGIPEMMDEMVRDIPDAEKGFRLLFSTEAFPGYTHKLSWLRGDKTGNWYYSEEYKKEGWLCPGLFKYYAEAPKELYVKAERKSEE